MTTKRRRPKDHYREVRRAAERKELYRKRARDHKRALKSSPFYQDYLDRAVYLNRRIVGDLIEIIVYDRMGRPIGTRMVEYEENISGLTPEQRAEREEKQRLQQKNNTIPFGPNSPLDTVRLRRLQLGQLRRDAKHDANNTIPALPRSPEAILESKRARDLFTSRNLTPEEKVLRNKRVAASAKKKPEKYKRIRTGIALRKKAREKAALPQKKEMLEKEFREKFGIPLTDVEQKTPDMSPQTTTPSDWDNLEWE